MKDFPGTPGTFTGLVLRISQCIFAVGSIASMATTTNFSSYTAFCVFVIPLVMEYTLLISNPLPIKPCMVYASYLIASMGLQVIWSFVLAVLDAYALVRKKVLHNPILVSLFVIGDWVMATLSLAAASASAGVTVLYFGDLGSCKLGEECQKYQMSVALAYMSWVTIAISSLIMLWLLAAG